MSINRHNWKRERDRLKKEQAELIQKLKDREGGILEESTANQFLITENDVPLVNINTPGIWSRERQIDFRRMYRRLSLFGVFGLESDISVKDPDDVLVDIPRLTEEAERNHQSKVRRFM